MSVHACPKCLSSAFTWFEEGPESHETEWRCCACSFVAHEGEELILPCPSCDYRGASYVLKSREGPHRWCQRCGTYEPVK